MQNFFCRLRRSMVAFSLSAALLLCSCGETSPNSSQGEGSEAESASTPETIVMSEAESVVIPEDEEDIPTEQESESESASETAEETQPESESESEPASETEKQSEKESEATSETGKKSEKESEKASETEKQSEKESASEKQSEKESEKESEATSETEKQSEKQSEKESEKASESEKQSEKESESTSKSEKQSEKQSEKESESQKEETTSSEKETETTSESESKKLVGELRVRTDLDPDQPMVAFSFDDGPSKNTKRIMSVLEEHDGLGTFFVVGERLETFSTTLQNLASHGHEIGCHTWDHCNLKKADKDTIRQQISSTNEKIAALTGRTVVTLRPPYGAVDDDVREVCKELGLFISYWSVDTLDWSTRDAYETFKAIKKETKDGSIILCHDLYSETADAVEKAVPWLDEQGYQLVTIPELLYYKYGGATTGKVYYSATKKASN